MPLEKLVRDRVPDSMPSATFRIARDDERSQLLCQVLREEVDHYLGCREAEKLADILEVVYELAAEDGVTVATLDAHRRAKRLNKGGFDRGFVWRIRP